MRNSLQFRLSLWMAVLLLATGVAAGALSFFWALHEANELQDDLLEQTAALVLAGQLSINPVEPASAPVGMKPRVVVELVDTAVAEPLVPGIGRLPAGLPDGLDTYTAEGHSWRMLLTHVADGRRIVVAQQTERRDDIAQDSALAALVPLVVLLPVLLLLVRVVIRNTLRPIAQASHRLDKLDRHGGIPQVNVPAGEMPDEVRPFVSSINALLGRLAEALEQQRRFVADAAHELRSPITALTVQAENLGHAEMSPEARKRFVPLREGLSRSRALLEQLLSLARVQARTEMPQQAVALHEVVREVVADLLSLAEARGVDLGVARLDPVQLTGTRVDVRTLVRNAVDNAVRYTPAGGRVDISVFDEAGSAVLRVDDSGPGIAPDQRERVFDAFYRLVGTQETGSGLGLSIARGIAQRLGGQITLGDAPAGGLRFDYRQPHGPAKLGGPLP